MYAAVLPPPPLVPSVARVLQNDSGAPHGMIDLALCMTVKSAELKAHKRHALEVKTRVQTPQEGAASVCTVGLRRAAFVLAQRARFSIADSRPNLVI